MRLFVGVPVSEEIKENIKPLISKLEGVDTDLNSISLQNLHFTLKFLGEIKKNKVNEIKEKLTRLAESFEKFEFELKNVGVFLSLKRTSIVWVGTSSGRLEKLMKEVNRVLNYFRKNERKEIPHLTIARVKSGRNKEKLQEFLKKVKNQAFGSMVVDKLILYKSELTSQGPIYEAVEKFDLR